jgi:hypothetical protein
MRILYVLSLALFSSCMVSAQGTGNRLADNIDTGRAIIAKLDHAAQDDPPPNFASSILVRNHQDVVNFIKLADTVSASVRRGNDPDATSMFTLYSEFINLFEQFDLYTTVETRPLALDKVRSTSMSKEYFETKTYFEVVTYAVVMRMEEELKSCHSPKPR